MGLFRTKLSDKEIRDEITAIYPRLWRYCLALTANTHTADDLAQSASLRALENINKFRTGSKIDGWIFRLTQRIWIDEVRKRVVRAGGGIVPVEEANLIDNSVDPETSLAAKEVIAGVMQLPEAQRSVVILVYVEGYSYRDAAMILDIPIGTVMSRLSIARCKLKQGSQSSQKVL